MSSCRRLYLIPCFVVIIFFSISFYLQAIESPFSGVPEKFQLEQEEIPKRRFLTQKPIIMKKNLTDTITFKDEISYQKPPFQKSKMPKYLEGDVLLKFKEGITKNKAEKQIRSVYKLHIAKRFSILSCITGKEYILVSQEGTKASELVKILKDDPIVEDASFNYSGQFFADCEGNIPNDPFFNMQWSLCNTGQDIICFFPNLDCIHGTPDADVDSTEAWDHLTGSSDVVVVVADTGVDYNHPDLKNNMWTNKAEINGITGIDDDGNGYIDDVYGFDPGENDTDPKDVMGHGTHVAGIISAEGNNGEGIAGMNFKGSIMAIKLATAELGLTVEGVLEAIEYIITMKRAGTNIVAMNASWGFYEYNEILKDAIKALGDEGIIVIAAAGNEGGNNDLYPPLDITPPAYPASFDLPNIISVAATDFNDRITPFSNYGSTSVDLGAPGSFVLSTFSWYLYDPGSGYDIFFDDMESGNDNWISHGDWRVTDEKAISPIHAWSGSPYGCYKENASYSLTSNQIDLSKADSPLYLGFYIQFELEEFSDSIDIYFRAQKPSLWDKNSENARDSEYAWSDSPYGNYPTNSYSWLTSPDVDLSESGSDTELSFWLTGKVENFYDVLIVFFSADGGTTWGYQGFLTGDWSNQWNLFSVPVPPEYQTSMFRVAYVLQSDSIITYDGFYIDDVEIKDGSTVFFYDDMESDKYIWVRPKTENWDYINSITGFSGPFWYLLNYPLYESCFWDRFQVRFLINSDSENNFDGVYLDNIGIGTPTLIQDYILGEGTSMAAPHVSGAVALLASEHSDEGAYTHIKRILTGVDPLPNSYDIVKTATGGRLNVYTSITLEMPTVKDKANGILDFFDESIAKGRLTGVGEVPFVSVLMLEILRDKIKKAENFIGKKSIEQACMLLLCAYNLTDGKPSPPDIVTGDAVPYLSFMIMDLRKNLGCDTKNQRI